MPRLEGERSSAGVYVILLILLILIAVVLLEYFGVINLLANVGRV